MLDGGQFEVRYSVNCKVFIGPERPEDIRCKRQRSKDIASSLLLVEKRNCLLER
ncbi:hypothetical protein AVEN_212498-1, partial [Araneus ventricosus]